MKEVNVIRPASPSDAKAMVTILNSERSRPLSADQFWDVRRSTAAWVIEDVGGKIVGWADLRAPRDLTSRAHWIYVVVAALHRRQGLGSKLLAVAESHASQIGSRGLYVTIRDNRQGTLDWALHRRYGLIRHDLESAMELAETPWYLWDKLWPPLTDDGAQVVRLSRLAKSEDQRRLFSLIREAMKDLPPPIGILPDSALCSRLFGGPAAWPEVGAVIVGAGGDPWALSAYQRVGGHPDMAVSEIVAVARSRRARGLGLAVTLAGGFLLREAGVVRVMFTHHAGNLPALRLNNALRMRPHTGTLLFGKTFRCGPKDHTGTQA